MTGPYRWINLAEAGLWITAGVIVGVMSLSRHPRDLRQLFLPLVLIAFGVSDIVETQTGAWWRPWWLLLWKGLCVVILLGFAVQFVRKRRATS